MKCLLHQLLDLGMTDQKTLNILKLHTSFMTRILLTFLDHLLPPLGPFLTVATVVVADSEFGHHDVSRCPLRGKPQALMVGARTL